MPLIKTVIKINDKYYAGETEDTYHSTFSGVGWVDYKNNQINQLKFTDNENEAYISEGNRNLKSTLDKIFQRVQDQELSFDNIEIIKIN